MKKKILLLAYYFFSPQVGWCIRIRKFAKYLPEFGFEQYILTVEMEGAPLSEPSMHHIYYTKSLDQKITSKSQKQQRNGNPSRSPWKWLYKLKNLFLIPDRQILWTPNALIKGREIIHKNNIQLIFATCPPYSTALIAATLAKICKVPLILDFRDDWLGTAVYFSKPVWRRRFERLLMLSAMKRAHYIIVVTERSRKLFESLGQRISKKLIVIPNGYDEEDFEELQPKSNSNQGPMRLVHLGNLPGTRNIIPLWEAFAELRNESPELRGEIKIIQYGTVAKPYIEKAQQLNLKEQMEFNPTISHKESLQVMVEADCLLCVPDQNTPTAIPGKLYEYLRAGPPIFFIGEYGAARDLFVKFRKQWIASPDDVEEIKDTLKMLYASYKKGELNNFANLSDIQSYGRRKLTRDLSVFLNEVIKSH